MSLLSIVQDSLREIGGFEVPTSVVGNTNETAVLSLALVNRSLKEVAKRSRWSGITIRGSINTVASQAEYALPSDYKSIINETLWDDTNDRQIIGPVSAKDWEFLKNSNTIPSWTSYFRIFRSASSNNNVFHFFPIPDAVYNYYYEYKSNGLAQSSGGTVQTVYLADTDVGLLDEDVIALGFKWRILKSRGLPYAEEFRDYEISIEDAASDSGADTISMGGTDFYDENFYIRFPNGNFAQ